MDPIVWKPLLEGADAGRALRAIDEVCALAAREPEAGAPWSLRDGSAAQALLLGYRSRQPDGERWRERCEASLERAADALATEDADPTLLYGFPGVLWCLAHARQRWALCPVEDDGEADEALGELVARGRWEGHHELLTGLAGLGVYALQKLPAASGRALLSEVVRQLVALAVEQPGGVSWFTPARYLPEEQRQQAPEGYFNLGVAHGMPAVLAVLAQALSQGVGGEAAEATLRRGLAWLRAQQVSDAEGPRLPVWTGPRGPQASAQEAWCYGAPGVAAVLLHVSVLRGEPGLAEEALELARAAARRRLQGPPMGDPGLCHGSAGVGHLFNRLYQATGDALLGDAARACFGWTLARYRPEASHRSLLTGSVGVALALLAAVSSEAPGWDALFLMDVPPRGA